MTKLAPEWVRTSDPVIRSPVRYRWTTAPARECSLVYHMYNDIKLTIIIARFVVMWYSMPPIHVYIYCHHSFHEELQKFKYHYQWHMCQCHSEIGLSRSCRAANTIYRLAEYCLEDPVGVNH